MPVAIVDFILSTDAIMKAGEEIGGGGRRQERQKRQESRLR
jgi:hypothetical protein